jgi:hypothetical protein
MRKSVKELLCPGCAEVVAEWQTVEVSVRREKLTEGCGKQHRQTAEFK